MTSIEFSDARNQSALDAVTAPKVAPKRARWTLFVPAPLDPSGRASWMPEGADPHRAACWRHALTTERARTALRDRAVTVATLTVLPGPSIRPSGFYSPTVSLLRGALGVNGVTTIGPVNPEQRPGVLIVAWTEP